MDLDECHRGIVFSVIEVSKQATAGNTGVEILENRQYEDPIRGNGQYTHKIFHIGEYYLLPDNLRKGLIVLFSRVPAILQQLFPANAFKLEEKSWNAYPYCKTVVTNPVMGDKFEIVTESMHLENDDGSTENALSLNPQQLKERVIELIDIGKDQLNDSNSIFEKPDPSKVVSAKTGRGPLTPGWIGASKPLMCIYKVAHIKFEVFGLQMRTESFIQTNQREILLTFYKQLFCNMDKWHDLSIPDLRIMERQVKEELERRLDELNLKTRDQKRIKDDQKPPTGTTTSPVVKVSDSGSPRIGYTSSETAIGPTKDSESSILV